MPAKPSTFAAQARHDSPSVDLRGNGSVEITAEPASANTPPLARGRWGDEQRQRERQLFAVMVNSATDSDTRMTARNDIVLLHMPLVDYCARRFRDRGEPFGDLVGYGLIGLIKAVDRFDPSRGLEFSTFAMPTIIGEIKRHFRDRARLVRIPRRLIDIASEAAAATSRLQTELGRQPEPAELARHIGIDTADVIEAQRTTSAHAVTSIDSLLAACADNGDSLPQQLVVQPWEFDQIEWREALRPALRSLNETQRQLLHLRFVEQMSQDSIAQILGVSQMHVSRLLTRLLSDLRSQLADAA